MSDPSELKDDELPFALVAATARTALALTSPLRTLTLAVSAVPVWLASGGDSVIVLLAELRTMSARRIEPSDGTAGFRSSFAAVCEPTPDRLVEDGASVWLIAGSESFTL